VSDEQANAAWSYVHNEIATKLKGGWYHIDAPWGGNRVTMYIFDPMRSKETSRGFHLRLAHQNKDFEKVGKRIIAYAKKIGGLIHDE